MGRARPCHAEGERQPSSQECGCRVCSASRGQQKAMAASGRSLGLLPLEDAGHCPLSLTGDKVGGDLEKRAVLLWPGLLKRMSATGRWGGDATVANLLQGPGTSSRSKIEEVICPGASERWPPNVTFPSSLQNPDDTACHGCKDLSDASGKERWLCGGFPQ